MSVVRIPPPKLEILRTEYDAFYEHLSVGAIIRSRATWYEYGEKSNKYFLNLESHKKSKSCIRQYQRGLPDIRSQKNYERSRIFFIPNCTRKMISTPPIMSEDSSYSLRIFLSCLTMMPSRARGN